MVSALTNSGIHWLCVTDSDFHIRKTKDIKNMRVHANRGRKWLSSQSISYKTAGPLFFPVATRPYSCSWPPLRGFTIHSLGTSLSVVSSGRVISPTQRPLPDNRQHSQKTSTPLAGLEPEIPASERQHTHALDSTATEIGNYRTHPAKLQL
jgi:hypothetical protein